MKKLMIAAAAGAMTIVANAAASFAPIDCDPGQIIPDDECPLMVFKLTASGKTVQDVNDGDYKTVKALKISKGALVFKYNLDCALNEGLCCYDFADLYATVKVGSRSYKLGLGDVVIDKWSVFGKNLDKAVNWSTAIKTGSSVKLESDLYLITDGGLDADTEPDTDALVVDSDDDLWTEAVDFAATAFGNFKVKVAGAKEKVNKGYCVVSTNKTSCSATWTPGTYNGWFVGTRELVNDAQACFNCVCGQYDLFGGTWKAVFQAKKTTDAAAQELAFGKKFKFYSLDPDDFEIEDDEDEDEDEEW